MSFKDQCHRGVSTSNHLEDMDGMQGVLDLNA